MIKPLNYMVRQRQKGNLGRNYHEAKGRESISSDNFYDIVIYHDHCSAKSINSIYWFWKLEHLNNSICILQGHICIVAKDSRSPLCLL